MTTEMTGSIIISQRCAKKQAQRSSLMYRLLLRRKLLAATSNLVLVRGLWVKKATCEEYDTALADLHAAMSRCYVEVVNKVAKSARIIRHGSWLGTAVLLFTDTIPQA